MIKGWAKLSPIFVIAYNHCRISKYQLLQRAFFFSQTRHFEKVSEPILLLQIKRSTERSGKLQRYWLAQRRKPCCIGRLRQKRQKCLQKKLKLLARQLRPVHQRTPIDGIWMGSSRLQGNFN